MLSLRDFNIQCSYCCSIRPKHTEESRVVGVPLSTPPSVLPFKGPKELQYPADFGHVTIREKRGTRSIIDLDTITGASFGRAQHIE